MKVTILGCGSSGGVPLITGDWGKCDPTNPKNYRLRASVLVQVDGFNILIDSSPDLRQQLIKAKVDRIDAVLYTHAHADHILGLDELRQSYNLYRKPIPIYADPKTLEFLHTAFHYAFEEKDPVYPAFLKAHTFDEAPFDVYRVRVIPYLQNHGVQLSYGFRIEDFAYSTDFKEIPPASLAKLQGLKLWVADCLKDEPHKTHAHYDLTMELIKELKPEKAILTHMTQHLDYEALRRRCPPGVEPAYDGMEITI